MLETNTEEAVKKIIADHVDNSDVSPEFIDAFALTPDDTDGIAEKIFGVLNDEEKNVILAGGIAEIMKDHLIS